MSQMKQCGVVYLWLGWDGKVMGQGNYVSEVWREVVVIGVREKDGKLIDLGDFIIVNVNFHQLKSLALANCMWMKI